MRFAPATVNDEFIFFPETNIMLKSFIENIINFDSGDSIFVNIQDNTTIIAISTSREINEIVFVQNTFFYHSVTETFRLGSDKFERIC